MPSDVQAIMDAAEQAAASNDYPSAARLLREAVALQERSLGSSHPDLANTLNNLGVVCERIGEIDESERCFRRAYSIAQRELPSDHPFVATSRENLEEFCRIHDRAFEVQAPSNKPEDLGEQEFLSESDPGQQGDQIVDHAGSEDPAYTALRSSSAVEDAHRGSSFAVIAVVAIAIVLMIGLGFIASQLSRTSTPNLTEAAEPPRPATRPEPPKEVATTPPPVETKPAPPAPAPSPPSPPAASTAPPHASGDVTVADARLCRTLTTSGAWDCGAVSGDVAPGPIYFFTRVIAERSTTVQHRWYVGDQLRQTVMLSIQPNAAGYRTYSRTTIAPERTGAWRVELRTEDGRLLRDQRFTVK